MLPRTSNCREKKIADHKIVLHDQWLDARKQLLLKEKEYTRRGDELAPQRRDQPWVRVEKEYVFDGPQGKETFAELFAGRSQLAVYHFMFAPDWQEGCKVCSFWADNFNGIDVHLAHRDVTFLVISHAPLAKLEAFKRRMGWSFKWVSAGENGFNYASGAKRNEQTSLRGAFGMDYHVSFTPEQQATGEIFHNYGVEHRTMPEHAGMSAFCKDPDGQIFYTYSCYARVLDGLNGAYRWLDRMPKGRDEDGLAFTIAWVQHHDKYDDNYMVDRSAGYQSPKPG